MKKINKGMHNVNAKNLKVNLDAILKDNSDVIVKIAAKMNHKEAEVKETIKFLINSEIKNLTDAQAKKIFDKPENTRAFFRNILNKTLEKVSEKKAPKEEVKKEEPYKCNFIMLNEDSTECLPNAYIPNANKETKNESKKEETKKENTYKKVEENVNEKVKEDVKKAENKKEEKKKESLLTKAVKAVKNAFKTVKDAVVDTFKAIGKGIKKLFGIGKNKKAAKPVTAC